MRLRLLACLALAAPAATLLPPREALACGGCFAPPTETTVVNAHRMVLSVSPVQSVLWDQIQYAGDPSEFAWVLPVKRGATLQVGSDAWFETLEAATSVRITAPNINCGGSSGGCGALASADAAGFGPNAGNEEVTVLHRGTVGPYETVTLATDTPGALNRWLDDNGFGVDDGTQPVIDAYVKEGFDFIALKLQPGKDVKEMKPVRVVMPGASPTLPLRMVAAGTGANVAITLFTISESRLAPDGFAAAAVPRDLLAWNFASQDSNYGELREKALAAADGGRAFLTPYAKRGSLFSPVSSSAAPFGVVAYTTSGSRTPVDTIAAAFAQQGLANGETQDTACGVRFAELAAEDRVVGNPCPAGAKLSDPSCDGVASGQIDARDLACGDLDDLAVAMIGLHPRDVWLTRLEANLPRAALDTDLVLSPGPQVPVDNWLRARVSVHPQVVCGAATPVLLDGDGASRSRGQGTLVGMTLGALALAAAVARRGARRFASRPA